MPEELREGLEYTKEALRNHVPKSEVVNGRLFIDGVEAYAWQLTVAELKQHFPDQYAARFGEQHVCCWPGCAREYDITTKVAWGSHFRLKHPEFYEAHGKLVDVPTWAELKQLVAAEAKTA
jgi:hypothetical protein